MAFDFYGRLAREDKKELMRALVVVASFRAAGRNPFLDYTQLAGFQKMPAVANLSPGVMLGIFFAEDFRHFGSIFEILAGKKRHGGGAGT